MQRVFFTLLFFSLIFVHTQNNTIVAGEKLSFTASYNMSGLLTDLAQVTMETSEVKTSKNTFLRLKFKAKTYSKWDRFFKINDLYESYVNPNSLKPYLYKREINEGGYYKYIKYNFDYKTNSIKSLKRKRRGNGTFWDVNKNLPFKIGTLDLVTTLYSIRNLDINKAKIGDSEVFKIIFDSKVTEVKITLLAIETISTEIGKKECYKLSISLNKNDILKGKDSNLIWLTADANKVPVYVKFKIAVGSGELRIQSATGLKH